MEEAQIRDDVQYAIVGLSFEEKNILLKEARRN